MKVLILIVLSILLNSINTQTPVSSWRSSLLFPSELPPNFVGVMEYYLFSGFGDSVSINAQTGFGTQILTGLNCQDSNNPSYYSPMMDIVQTPLYYCYKQSAIYVLDPNLNLEITSTVKLPGKVYSNVQFMFIGEGIGLLLFDSTGSSFITLDRETFAVTNSSSLSGYYGEPIIDLQFLNYTHWAAIGLNSKNQQRIVYIAPIGQTSFTNIVDTYVAPSGVNYYDKLIAYGSEYIAYAGSDNKGKMNLYVYQVSKAKVYTYPGFNMFNSSYKGFKWVEVMLDMNEIGNYVYTFFNGTFAIYQFNNGLVPLSSYSLQPEVPDTPNKFHYYLMDSKGIVDYIYLQIDGITYQVGGYGVENQNSAAPTIDNFAGAYVFNSYNWGYGMKNGIIVLNQSGNVIGSYIDNSYLSMNRDPAQDDIVWFVDKKCNLIKYNATTNKTQNMMTGQSSTQCSKNVKLAAQSSPVTTFAVYNYDNKNFVLQCGNNDFFTFNLNNILPSIAQSLGNVVLFPQCSATSGQSKLIAFVTGCSNITCTPVYNITMTSKGANYTKIGTSSSIIAEMNSTSFSIITSTFYVGNSIPVHVQNAFTQSAIYVPTPYAGANYKQVFSYNSKLPGISYVVYKTGNGNVFATLSNSYGSYNTLIAQSDGPAPVVTNLATAGQSTFAITQDTPFAKSVTVYVWMTSNYDLNDL